MNTIFKKYKDSKIYMVSGLGTLGVPYTIDNINSQSFIDLLAYKFKEEKVNVEYVNLCTMASTTSYELINILEKNYSKGAYYKQNRHLNSFVISSNKKYKHSINPLFFYNYYRNIQNPELKITTNLINSKNPIFIYTFDYLNINYIKDIKKLLCNLEDNIIKIITDIDECLNYIINLNSDIEIYVLGLYSNKNSKILSMIIEYLYNYCNEFIKSICERYPNVHYVDIFELKNFIDYNTPTLEGQKFISKQIIKTMNSTIK